MFHIGIIVLISVANALSPIPDGPGGMGLPPFLNRRGGMKYGPGGPIFKDPRLKLKRGINPFLGFEDIPIRMKECRPATGFTVDAIFNSTSLVCPKSDINIPDWPVTDAERRFYPVDWWDGYRTQKLFPCFNNAKNDPTVIQHFKKIFRALESYPDSFEHNDFVTCASKLYTYKPNEHMEKVKYFTKPVCKTIDVDLTREAIWHTYNGRQYKCLIVEPQRLFSVTCEHPRKKLSDKCDMGYKTYPEYRCAPTNFVRRRMVIACPGQGIDRIFWRTFDVPTACSCKICYECDKNVIPDPRVYLQQQLPHIGGPVRGKPIRGKPFRRG